ncbi:MAG: alkaline phosphatase family protein [Planctomycetes bacterium]|nr:alkaline phosphatase family protein [Planctomycetota bacterium]
MVPSAGKTETPRDRRGGAGARAAGWLTRRRLAVMAGALAVAVIIVVGCAYPLQFPPAPLLARETAAGFVRAYDTNADRRADYFTIQDASGRIVRIGYSATGAPSPTDFVNLDEIPAANCRHVVLILDGIGYDAVEAFRQEGRLRLFHAPARLISTFPSMTDLALTDAFRGVTCVGYEVVYFDRATNAVVGGDADYMGLKNESWVGNLAYRAGTLMDPLSYLYPDAIFEKELGDFKKVFDRRDRTDVAAYFVGTAGLATRQGAEGQRKVLEAVDRLVEELVQKTRGLVKVTAFSDHGHMLVRCDRVDFRKYLQDAGWRVADRLEKPRDVVPVEYGILTYASFATHDRADLVATLLQHPGVDLVVYGEPEAVAVEKPGAKALVERRGGRYRYRAPAGDPLGLAPVLEKMRADGLLDADGFAADADWFDRTLTHTYPDAPDRLWRAFNGLAEHVPDVVASLKDGYCAGSSSRAFWLPYVASTHGDLERKSSTAFIMSTAGPLLEPGRGLRHRDVPALMERLTRRPWPPPAEGKPK